MSVKTLRRMGNPILKKMAELLPTDQFSSPMLFQLIQDLKDTMKANGGIGIAAPQIGVSLQVAIIEIPADNARYGHLPASPLFIIINPKVTPLSEEVQEFYEGCLSVPGLRGLVKRHSKIQIDYFDEKGIEHSLKAENFLATVFQHEIDHLFGKLYVERMDDFSTLCFTEEYDQYVKASE